MADMVLRSARELRPSKCVRGSNGSARAHAAARSAQQRGSQAGGMPPRAAHARWSALRRPSVARLRRVRPALKLQRPHGLARPPHHAAAAAHRTAVASDHCCRQGPAAAAPTAARGLRGSCVAMWSTRSIRARRKPRRSLSRGPRSAGRAREVRMCPGRGPWRLGSAARRRRRRATQPLPPLPPPPRGPSPRHRATGRYAAGAACADRATATRAARKAARGPRGELRRRRQTRRALPLLSATPGGPRSRTRLASGPHASHPPAMRPGRSAECGPGRTADTRSCTGVPPACGATLGARRRLARPSAAATGFICAMLRAAAAALRAHAPGALLCARAPRPFTPCFADRTRWPHAAASALRAAAGSAGWAEAPCWAQLAGAW